MNPFYDPKILDQFKAQIHYSSVINNLPEGPKGLINWQKALGLIVVDGEPWSLMQDASSAILNDQHASMSYFFEHADQQISVEVHAFTQKTKVDVLDFMLTMLASTSMAQVPYKLVVSNEHMLYFSVPQIEEASRDASAFVFMGNLVLQFDTADSNASVRRFANSFVSTVRQQYQQTVQFHPPTIKTAVSAKVLNVGNTFCIQVATKNPEQLRIEVDMQSVEGSFDLLSISPSRIELKALTAGDHTVRLRYMDVYTLFSQVHEVLVHVQP